MGIQKITLSSHATAISMPLHEHKELQMNFGNDDIQAMMAFNPGLRTMKIFTELQLSRDTTYRKIVQSA